MRLHATMRAAGYANGSWQLIIQGFPKLIAEDSPVLVTAYPGWPLAVNKRLGGVEAASLWYWQSLFKNVYVK